MGVRCELSGHSSGGPAAAVSSEHGGGSRVALSTATKYPHAL